MDSLTQIVLGAAVGEAVAGRKIGNRAMVWGAIGGTIPDLDVVSNLWMREIDALAVHRGITHSVFFSLVAPLLFGWLVHSLYSSGAHKSRFYKWIIAALNIVLIAFLVTGNYWITGSLPMLVVLAIPAAYLIWRIYRYYIKTPQPDVRLTYAEWYILFFVAFITHIALDCFTAYGTQVLQPFSNIRVAFDTISVVDPMYTIPFLVCVVAAAIHGRTDPARRFVNYLGLALSTLYLAITIHTKSRVSSVLESTLQANQIKAERIRTSPTILQNLLWNCIAETDSAFYLGLYSLYDSTNEIQAINRIDKDFGSMTELEPFEEYRTLKWFSNGYFVTRPLADGYEFVDIRYGAMQDSVRSLRDFVFRFSVVQHQSRLEVHQIEEWPEDRGKMFREFLARIKGN